MTAAVSGKDDPTILILNAGSSSIKFDLYAGEEELVRGQIEGLGATPRLQAKVLRSGLSTDRPLSADEAHDHQAALAIPLKLLEETAPGRTVQAVGHRVVHGGVDYAEPVVLDDAILAHLKRFNPLAPLHQPHNLAGILAARQAFPDALQVACFDTAFHRRHPWVNDTFALPREFYDEGVRRYGFHGLSYEYITETLRERMPEAASGRLVVAHLGNGASMCAIREGRSIGSTMGFTALDGLPMGTRCGQLDPGVVLYLMTEKGLSANDISDLLYKRSGLRGLSGLSHDMRELEASDTPEARQAIDYFVFRIRRELGAMAAVVGGLDTLVFTGGIGENSTTVRARVCEGLEWLGIRFDAGRNAAGESLISTNNSKVQVLVMRTNEEAMIRRHTARLFGQAGARP
ncbi:acetate/propionate family kinase [Polymorphum gilvum]|uniref:Acetate kinase n=1 Tax=Polymorphum gilvum (strain LMG 25793 / CGMCC 1.9160 / SL003B-26A1) TaxID=991905 RepID=F2J2R8_POLGS|nr:acetate/propionate family kinase [Polymorphum gilvum]ADZ72092.1 Propionate kinase/acetate kinase C, anaerobic [Polymorphum gilvum SL003B-26A1]